MKTKRFRIAFSFAGEIRDYVAKVARILADQFGQEAILYDKYHEAEFARHDLGIYLPKLYGEESELIVPVLCPSYDPKKWTGWEWLEIHSLLTKADGHRVMPSRFNHANVDGLSAATGFIELDSKTPEQFATLILERLALNEGHVKDHYTKSVAPGSNPPSTAIPNNLPRLQSFPKARAVLAVLVIAAIAFVLIGVWWWFPRACVPSAARNKLTELDFKLAELKTHDGAPLVEVKGINLYLADLSEVAPYLSKVRCGISLVLDNCDQITSLDVLDGAPIIHLDAMSCDGLTHLWQPGALNKLESLNLSQSKGLSRLDGCSHLSKLALIDATECKQLSSLSALSDLPQLSRLILTNCGSLTSAAVGGTLPVLAHLEINGCSKLNSLDALCQMPALTYLDISGCTGLTSLEMLPTLNSLQTVVMCDNAGLSNVDGLKQLPVLKTVYVGTNKNLFKLAKKAVPKVHLLESCPKKEENDEAR